MERVAYTPKEFAALFGKSQTWGYRQIYSGAVAATTEHGRTLIPAREVEKILGTAQPKGKKPQQPAPPSPRAAEKQDNSLRSVLIRGSRSRSKNGRSPKISSSQPPPTS